jgi:hypothetical protein
MNTWLMDQFERGDLNLAKLEDLLWKSTLYLFRHLMGRFLEMFDQQLMADRDKARYELKEKNERTIQTLVGEVTFRRRYYRDHEESRWVYLLDEKLGLEQATTIGPGLLRLAVTWATKGPSYRDARNRLTDLYGAQVVSHEAIRQALLSVADVASRDRENEIVRAEGTREVEALFIEVDGFGARLQKNQNRSRQNRRREVKLAVIHEGWEPRTNGQKKDYRLVNPSYIPIVNESKDFWEYVRGRLQATYKDIDSIPVVINGDGASWIREGADCFGNGMYQYDRFHVSKALNECLPRGSKELSLAHKALTVNDMGSLLSVVTAAWAESEDPQRREKLGELKTALQENYEYIEDYRIRLRRAGYKVPSEWRSMGAAESNVNKFKNRTAKRGRAWSIEGLQAVLTTLSELYQGDLHKHLTRKIQEAEEWILDKLNTGISRIAKKAPLTTVGEPHRAGFPATQRGTQGYAKLFRALQEVELL